MAASGFTPIQLYYSTTATNVPTSGNLAYGELAINITDGKMYYKNSSNVVTKIADAATATGSVVGGTAGAIVYQSAPSTSAFVSIGTNGFILTSNGSIPTYTNPTAITVGTATTATNIAGGSANQIAYQSGAGTTTFAPAPSTAGYVLGWTGSAFSWVAAPAATSATNLAGGGAYTVVYQSSAGNTAYVTNGTTGQAFIANTSGAPTWGTLGIAGGGTNSTATPTAGAVPYGTGTAFAFTAVGSAGQVLQSNGASPPTWVAATATASAGGVIWENSTTISSNYTLSTNKNGLSVGPITIASGAVVTVPTGQRWVVL